jgi:hypothetical protein
MPQGIKPHHVMVVAALNCSKKAAQHADFITRSLQAQNISVQRVNSVQFSPTSREDAAQIQALMQAGPPVVFYGGKAQSNPSWDEVLAMIEKAPPH